MAANGSPAPNRQYDTEEQRDAAGATEATPLLAREASGDQSQPQRERSAESLLQSIQNGGSGGSGKKSFAKARWPSILALLLLCIAAVLIMVFAFFAPSVVEQYAAEAAVFEPTSLSIDSFTTTGVRARVQGNFYMDAARVQKKSVRDLGRFGTWIAREVESGDSEVEVSLPEYGNVVLGTAVLPSIKVDVRNGHTTHVDFLSDLAPGSKEGIRRIARDWIDGRLGQLRVVGKARVPIKSGVFSLGTQSLTHEVLFDKKEIPSIPAYDIQRLNFHDQEGARGMQADVSLAVANPYPVDFAVPPLGFQMLVQSCEKTDPYIKVADAATDDMHVRPKHDLELNVTGVVHKLPEPLTQNCPGADRSPLDRFLGRYIEGKENTVYVRGAKSPSDKTPQWVEDLMSDIVVPVPLPGRGEGHLIKEFALADTNFHLPDPFADPSKVESKPRISAKVKALVALPEEMNFNLSANRVRANADVYYKGDKFGTLDLNKWQKANSTRIEATKHEGPGLLVESFVDKAPLNIEDEEIFASVLQDLVFGGKKVVLHIKASVDVQVETALGEFKVQRIPAEGEVPVKRTGSGAMDPKLAPKISDLQIVDTTPSSLTIAAWINITNPTNYSASVPYVDIHIVKNGSVLGRATARDLHIRPGRNDNLLIQAVYDPLSFGGRKAKDIGRELLSQYISGWNTTLSVQTHRGTIPSQPKLGEALSKFIIEIPAPRLKAPSPPDDGDNPPDDSPDDGKGHFIRDATMHLFSSTATFTLFSPLRHSTLYIEDLDATALYKGDDVGRIEYDLPFAVPPVDRDGKGVTTPRLPVQWNLGSVGYEAVKGALGGTLRLAANAEVGVRLGRFRERIWFRGGGIGVRISW
ncbi:hypothetical protein BDY17DRAFT_256085 [Neohortaea acidophila]|uniref:Pre-rRNA processing protein n=1 Tax=Neohortaea acidophila TaxID=245834 RepID=A0A6A6PK25_9PEZI|nr:uncharacterized protein BDY17DRAFT_256085 [Neohortaea acidophila]KAF2479863.1 hypothetical protein BDY17DRAFT_256085 [Neohortaea acidophila]